MASEREDAHQPARVGDWLEVAGLPGRAPRTGLVLEVLGGEGHVHYRVRWDEHHESIFFPTEGVHVRRAADGPGERA
jgi:hypothetical protein